jgi:hypothetical protein
MLYWLSKPTKRLIVEVSVGVILFDIILGVAAVLICPKASYPVVPVLKGLCVGAVAAILMLIHMADTTERALSSGDPDYAKKVTIAQSMIRRVVFLAGLAVCWYVLKADLLATVIGTMGLKPAAFLQPIIHKVSGAKDEPYTEAEVKEEESGTETKLPDTAADQADSGESETS